MPEGENRMSTTTLIIVILIVLFLFGGFGYRRWRR
jgi:LPXTG-motif cell wall-anchored protein